MKACPNHEKSLTLLALEVLPESRKPALERHLESCRGCEKHLADLRGISLRLSEPVSEVDAMELPPGFHRTLMGKIKAERGEMRADWAGVLGGWLTPPRLAGFGIGIAALVLMIMVLLPEPNEPLQLTHPILETMEPVSVGSRFPQGRSRTLFAYQQALIDSPEALDAMLLDQARRDPGGDGMTLLTASGVTL